MGSRLLIAFLIVWPVLCSTAHAQYQRHIEAVLPRVGQRGTTVEVDIQGMFLADPQQVLFYRSGIRAEQFQSLPDLTLHDPTGKIMPLEKRIGGRAFGAKVQEQFRATLVIAPDCPVGLHPLRVRTGKDLTTLSTFWVTPFPVQFEAEPFEGSQTNDSVSTAEKLAATNTTVAGYINSGQTMDHDVYRVTRKKGERISVEVNSVRLSTIWCARQELDVLVRILDAAGKELAISDDAAMFVQDPLVSILAPEDGDYFIEIVQSLYSTTVNSFYLHYLANIGAFETPLAVYPAGGPAGQALDVTLLGDPLGDRPGKLSLPS